MHVEDSPEPDYDPGDYFLCMWKPTIRCIEVDNCCRFDHIDHEEWYCCKTRPDFGDPF